MPWVRLSSRRWRAAAIADGVQPRGRPPGQDSHQTLYKKVKIFTPIVTVTALVLKGQGKKKRTGFVGSLSEHAEIGVGEAPTIFNVRISNPRDASSLVPVWCPDE